MYKTPYEYEVNMIEQAFGKGFLEDFHQYDLDTGGEKEDITDMFLLEYLETLMGEEKFETIKPVLISSLLNRIFLTYSFYKHGKKIFRFEKNLTEMLLKTDLNNVDAEYVKPPFTCIYIDVPFNLFTKDVNGTNYSLRGLYVYDMPVDHMDTETLDKQLGKGYIKLLRMQAIFTTEEKYEDDTDSIVHNFSLRLKKGNIFEQLKDNYSRSTLEDFEIELSDEMISFVVNAILYLHSDKKVLHYIKPQYLELLENKKSPKKRKKLERKYSNLSKLAYYQVGRDIVIDNKSNKRVNSANQSNTKETAQPKQWIVRGHWRNQAFGPGLKERKYVWVRPYIKGNEEGSLVEKNYTVK